MVLPGIGSENMALFPDKDKPLLKAAPVAATRLGDNLRVHYIRK